MALTAAQRRVLSALEELLAESAWPPTVREIMVRAGLASPSTVQAHLGALERGGWVERGPAASARAIRRTAKPA
jgi:repressor LexA